MFRTLAVLLLLACGYRDLRLFGRNHTARTSTIDSTSRHRSRMPPSSAFALAALDVESLACISPRVTSDKPSGLCSMLKCTGSCTSHYLASAAIAPYNPLTLIALIAIHNDSRTQMEDGSPSTHHIARDI
eukprot:4084854-Pleurochrysis_carterae.AAC.1